MQIINQNKDSEGPLLLGLQKEVVQLIKLFLRVDKEKLFKLFQIKK